MRVLTFIEGGDRTSAAALADDHARRRAVRDRRARRHPAKGGPPWLALRSPPSGRLRLIAIGYVFLLVGWPMITLVQHAFADGLGELPGRLVRPRRHARPAASPSRSRSGRSSINTVFGVGMALLLVRYEFPGKRVLSALIDLPMSVSPVVDRPRPAAGLQRPRRLVRPDPGGPRPRGDLQQPRHDHGDLLRGAAPGRPRGRAGARGDRRRPGAGRPQPRRQRRPDPPPDHAAGHQVGRRVRRRPLAWPARSASSAPSRSSRAT